MLGQMTTDGLGFDMNQVNIPIIYSRIISSAVGKNSTEVTRILLQAGLIGNHEQTGYMSNQQYKLLLRSAREISADPLFALKAASQLPFSVHGPLGIAGIAAATLGEALETLSRFAKLRIPFGTVHLSCEAEFAYLEIKIDVDFEDVAEAALDFIVSTFISSFKGTASSPLSYARLQLNRPEPSYSESYRKILGLDIVFNCERNALVLAKRDLNISLMGRNKEEYSAAIERLQRLYQPLSGTRNLSETLVDIFVENTGHLCVLDEVAQQLHITPRTLQRRLRVEGDSFQKIRDSWLTEQAAHYLAVEGLSVDVTANILGYSDASNFRRSFKRFTGKLPSQASALLASN